MFWHHGHGETIRAWSDTRRIILTRDNYMCQVCGCDLSGEWDKVTVHHLTPRFRGGKDTLENLVTLCEGCHKKIHQMDYPRSGIRGIHAIEVCP
jgi:5-methylcytosine-specific restriction endonuclease McrA